MLSSARRQYEQQQRITALAVRTSRTQSGAGLARALPAYQLAMVQLALQSADAVIAEQRIDGTQVGTVNQAALLTPAQSFAGMIADAADQQGLERLVQTLVADAARTATLVDIATRPAVTGHIRYLSPPSCSRCAVLAGRFYRWSDGFQRHPRCDCVMVPSTHAASRGLVSDPMQAFRAGQVRGLSKADAQAVNDGADLAQVVNVRRRQAGLLTGSSVMERAGRLTPAGIYRLASTKAEALSLLRRLGYIT